MKINIDYIQHDEDGDPIYQCTFEDKNEQVLRFYVDAQGNTQEIMHKLSNQLGYIFYNLENSNFKEVNKNELK